MKDMICRAPDNAEETHLLDSKIFVELFKNKDKQECVDFVLTKEASKLYLEVQSLKMPQTPVGPKRSQNRP
jgi:hypothetical protein